MVQTGASPPSDALGAAQAFDIEFLIVAKTYKT